MPKSSSSTVKTTSFRLDVPSKNAISNEEIHDEITLVLTPSTTTINDNVSNKKRIFKELGDILVNPIIVALNDYCKYKTSLF